VAGRAPAGPARTSEIRISSSSDEQRLLEIRISLVLTPRAARRHDTSQRDPRDVTNRQAFGRC